MIVLEIATYPACPIRVQRSAPHPAACFAAARNFGARFLKRAQGFIDLEEEHLLDLNLDTDESVCLAEAAFGSFEEMAEAAAPAKGGVLDMVFNLARTPSHLSIDRAFGSPTRSR